MINEVPKQTLADLLFSLRLKINESAKKNRLKQQLTVSQFEILWLIATTGKRSMESIANHLHIKPPSATALVDKMEQDGFVVREKDPHDRRVVNISLTAKTQRLFSSFQAQRKSAFDQMIAKISAKDRKELERILLRLISN